MNRKGNGRFWNRKRADNKATKGPKKDRPSVHSRNINLVASPLLFILAFLRIIAFQLWVVLELLVGRASCLLPVRCQSEKGKGQVDAEEGIMSGTNKNTAGPASPTLTTQKHHHRKAFEFISKALKLDEENDGNFPFLLNICICSYRPILSIFSQRSMLPLVGKQAPSW